ncbi:GTPase Era [Garciella nitratireducens]|uniref:GTPase Era n=1 Tax=Garciella nitratireducens DSM 15102 TaxID=1121911 RepID=A0A1T4JRR0_9FIRM|nr:GTPase Era [Garciella nitratireducens]RBP45504.1 GTP-binding protein Era [Garciella nitratireducens]SJZ32823.1 GTP-binding protein Era [Garciella nitratireducens DSM 15102]
MKNNYRSGFVAMIGRPNVGKSTLLNQIMKEKVVIISNKPQTTRNIIRLIYTQPDYQIIFIDTPGIHKPKNRLGEYMVNAAKQTLNEVDVVVFLVDESMNIGPGDQYILEMLKDVKTPVLLVINKIDLLTKEQLLEKIALYKHIKSIDEIIPVSARNHENIEKLMEVIANKLPIGPQYFPEDMIIDQPEKKIVEELVREKALQLLQQEVPHGIATEVISMKERKGRNLIDIDINIYCEKNSHKGIIIGKQGKMLKEIGQRARKDIENLLGIKVNLQLWVKVKPDWRNKFRELKDLGYQ